jgi:hypothetical protein
MTSPLSPSFRPSLLLAAIVGLLGSACAKPLPAGTTATTQTATEPSADDGCAAQTELNGLDARRPVPLQPMMALHQKQNMQAHLEVVQRVVDALARQDFEAVAAASKEIEPSTSMTQMCNHMGAGAEGFTPQALAFHDRAKAIGEAANAKDTQAVLAGLSSTLQTCTGCHATYRQEVVTAAEWERRTGQAGPDVQQMHGGGHGMDDQAPMHGTHGGMHEGG